MEIEAVPPLDGSGQRAVIEAFERTGVRVDVVPAFYDSPWRAAGLKHAVEEDEPEGYTPSPRSTRGATRA